MNQIISNKAILIFDGYCNLCSGLVQFIIKRDKKDFFRFVALQSDKASQILLPFNLPLNYSDSVILILGDKIFLKSDAVLKITPKLGGFWFLFSALKIIPKPIRDFFYDLIAKHRYKWFGMKKNCFIPAENQQHKFYFSEILHK